MNFVFDAGFTTYQYITGKTGVNELLLKNRINVVKGVKTNKPIPTHMEVPVSPDVMKTYTGVYEIQPNFSLAITLEDGHLMSQATGQAKFEIYPESPTKFFLKVVEAQIEFISGSEAKVNSLILYQGGQKIEGKRKD